MRKSYFGLFAVLFIVLAFMVTGCAKKAEPPKPVEEIKAPVAAPAPAPAPVKPAEEVKIQTQAPMPSLDDEIKALQEKNIFFDFDKFDLKPEAQEILNQDGTFLKAHSNVTIQIAGNCDERGTVEYNLALGERRAKAAMDFLVTLGIEKERISTISYGKEKPLDPGHTEEAWAKNRNDQFVIINK
jgi:peptidoglycan-associated lipoprotein